MKGFGEVAGHACFGGSGCGLLGDVGGDGNNGNGRVTADTLILADSAGGFDAVHVGHLKIHEDAIEGFACGGFEGFESVGDDGWGNADFFEVKDEELLIDVVVFRDEDAEVCEGGGERRWGGGFGGSLRGRGVGQGIEGDAEVEATTLTGLALDPNFPTHEGDDFAADGEAKAGAAVGSSRACVGLGEGLEDCFLKLRRDAAARVRDGEDNLFEIGVEVDRSEDFSGFRKFDGVADEIEEDLSEAGAVGPDLVRAVGSYFLDEAEGFGACGGFLQIDCLGEQLGEIHGCFVEFHAPAFDFAEVEQVVEEEEEGFSTGLNGADKSELLVVEMGVAEEFCEAEEAVKGGANFMAHDGKKFIFGGVGALSRRCGFFGAGHGGLEIAVDGFEVGVSLEEIFLRFFK